MSCGFSEEISEKTSTKVIGNAWNYHQMSAIFRHLRVPELERQMSNHNAQIDDLIGISSKERKLLDMSDDEQRDHFKEKMTGYSLAELKVMLADEQTVPYQVPVKTRMNTPAARIPAALAELKLRMKRGHLKVCAHKQEQWIAAMFYKSKGRITP